MSGRNLLYATLPDSGRSRVGFLGLCIYSQWSKCSTQPYLLLLQLLYKHMQKHGNTDRELLWTAGKKGVVNYDSSPANVFPAMQYVQWLAVRLGSLTNGSIIIDLSYANATSYMCSLLHNGIRYLKNFSMFVIGAVALISLLLQVNLFVSKVSLIDQQRAALCQEYIVVTYI